MLYERLLRPLLFSLDPERAHDAVTAVLEATGRIPLGAALLRAGVGRPPSGLETEVLGLRFSNPLGLAAGFDKDCRLARALPALGFGFLEVGSVTLRPQPGNARPRLFRVPESEALINRMGFNNDGAEACAARLAALGRRPVPIGVNLGLNADCPRERAAAEYARAFELLAPHGDYFVVNVSSPNTAGLRALQERLQLERILSAIQAANPGRKPVLVKIDCDMPEESLADLVGLARRAAAGIVASNTTLARDGVPEEVADTRGGLSGAPLRERSTRLIRRVRELAGPGMAIIGVGGIMRGLDALDKLRAGADLVQLYTGLVYRGPGVVRRVLTELKALREADRRRPARREGSPA